MSTVFTVDKCLNGDISYRFHVIAIFKKDKYSVIKAKLFLLTTFYEYSLFF